MEIVSLSTYQKFCGGLVLAILCFSQGAKSDSGRCFDLFSNEPKLSDPTVITNSDRMPLVFENGFALSGAEAEFALKRSERLLSFYHPPEFAIEQWNAKSHQQKMEWLREKFPYNPKESQVSGLKLNPTEAQKNPFLPHELNFEANGTLELIFPPVDTVARFAHLYQSTEFLFKKAGWHDTSGVPRAAYFKGNAQTQPTRIQNFKGFQFFLAEYDAFRSLINDFRLYEADSKADDASSLIARDFLRSFMGPMDKPKQDSLAHWIDMESSGRASELNYSWIKEMDDSFKYVGTSVYRPDIGREKTSTDVSPYVVFETRLEKTFSDRMRRKRQIFEFFKGNKEDFSRFADLKLFDPTNDFAKLPREVQEMVRDLFPVTLFEGTKYTPEELVALQTYRRFAFPLKSWSQSLQRLGANTEEKARVLKAQQDYLNDLKQINMELKSQKIDKEQASVRSRLALSNFALGSGVERLYEKYISTHLPF